jgi:HK97 family phage prohead protease
MITNPQTVQLRRAASFISGTIDKQARTVQLSFSSPEPCKRLFGVEVLSHEPGAMVDDRFRRGAVPFLLNHDWDRQIGTIVDYGVSDGRGFAMVRLSRSSEGDDVLKDIEDQIRTNISVGYIVHEMICVDQGKDEEFYVVTKWEPLELSLVSVPADSTVGIGRSMERPPSEIARRAGAAVRVRAAIMEIAYRLQVPDLGRAWLRWPMGSIEDFESTAKAWLSQNRIIQPDHLNEREHRHFVLFS